MTYLSRTAHAIMRLTTCCALVLGLVSCGGGGGGGGDAPATPAPTSPLPEPVPTGSALFIPYYAKNALLTFQYQENNYKVIKTAPIATGVNPIALTATPYRGNQRCVFAANEGSNNVSIFKSDKVAGFSVASPATIAAGAAPSGVSTDGTITLVTNFGDSTVSRYATDPNTCNLTFLGVSAVGKNPSTITMLGKYALVTSFDNKIQVYDVDPATGALTAKGAALATGAAPFSLIYWDGINSEATVYPVVVANRDSNSVSVYSFNVTTGAISKVGADLAAGSGPSFAWVLILPNAKVIFYIANGLGNSISSYEANLTTQVLTPIGTTVSTLSQPFLLAQSFLASTINKYLYAFHEGTDDVSAYEIDQSTGALRPLGSAL
jgi:6-phosphogluconolactonase